VTSRANGVSVSLSCRRSITNTVEGRRFPLDEPDLVQDVGVFAGATVPAPFMSSSPLRGNKLQTPKKSEAKIPKRNAWRDRLKRGVRLREEDVRCTSRVKTVWVSRNSCCSFSVAWGGCNRRSKTIDCSFRWSSAK
jgi:hypothetical protein